MQRNVKTVSRAIRSHLPFVVIVPLLIGVMTWPTLPQLLDGETFAVPTRNTDVYQKLWDVWHGRQFLAGETSFYHSEVMFYPLGVSLAYENFSLPQMLSVGLLSLVLPPASAYSLTYLLIVLAVAVSGYVYLDYLFRDRWLATLGASVICLSQHVLAHAAHPDVNLIVSLPLSAYFFQRAMREERLKHLVICGAVVGLTAFLSLYIFICALLSLALIVLAYAIGRWKEGRFWRWMLLLGLVIALTCAGRVLPMIADAGALEAAISKNTTRERGTDLLSYFVNYRHPLTTPPLKALFGAGSPFYEPHSNYLGYLPLALILFGLARAGSRRKILPWLALALPFLLLRLGSVLQIDGEQFSHIVLPKALLDELFPLLFQPFHAPDHFHIGILLPLAVMTGYGLQAVLDSRPAKQRALITLAVIAVVAFEYYETTELRRLPEAQFAFIDWLREEDGEPRVINLPMGRYESKLYGLYQTMTGYPQVEGLSGRTPPSAYAYIDGNHLLDAWRGGAGARCFPPHESIYLAALEQLLGDGFTHVVWHHWLRPDWAISGSFAYVSSAYSDEYVSVYRLRDFRQNCELADSVSRPVLGLLRRLEGSTVIVPQQGSAILSMLPTADASPSAEKTTAGMFGMRGYSSLSLMDGRVVLPGFPQSDAPDTEDLLAGNSLVLLAYDGLEASAEVIAGYRAWLADRFKSCRQIDEAGAVVEVFLEAAFACDLAIAAQPLAVDYANGIQLGNLLFDIQDEQAELQLLWTRLPEEAHSISIQFMDADGARAAGQDFVIGLEPLAAYRIDLSSLPAGEYRVKLILYDFATGVSVPGMEMASQARFERALEIARFGVEPRGGSDR